MKEDKKAYSTKKEAKSRLNFLSESVGLKKAPTRCYEIDGKWYITSHPGRKLTNLKEMLEIVLKDSASRKREFFKTKSDMEEEARLRKFLIKQLELYNARNNS